MEPGRAHSGGSKRRRRRLGPGESVAELEQQDVLFARRNSADDDGEMEAEASSSSGGSRRRRGGGATSHGHHRRGLALLPLVAVLGLLLALVGGVRGKPLQHPAGPGDDDDLGPPPIDLDDPFWQQTYDINGRPVTLGQLSTVLNQSRPHYYWDRNTVICAPLNGAHPADSCCPSYCCNVESTAHNLSQPIDMSFRQTQTASLNGTFQVLSWEDGSSSGNGGGTDGKGGIFVGVMYRDFEKPIQGGWTLEVHFSKPVFDLHSFNARIVGVADGGVSWFMKPEAWNRNIPKGNRRLLVQGLTTPTKQDGIPLTATGALWYDPTQQLRPGPPPHYTFTPEPRPLPAPKPTKGERYNLAEVLQLSTLFYEVQRSGRLPKSNHIPWRGDSAVNDGADVGKDLSGGWYDAGDFIKFHVPMAYSTVLLLWGLIRYQDAYEAAGQLEAMRDAVRWPLDYFVKSHTAPDELYVQVSDEVDHCMWGPPESMDYPRRSYKVTCQNPGTQPVMNTAAALAAGSIAFRQVDPNYASMLLQRAQQLYDFGERCPGDYIVNGTIPAGRSYSDGGKILDKQAFAAAWLHKATGNKVYLDKAVDAYWDCCSRYQQGDAAYRALSWADMTAGVNLLLYEALGWDDFADVIVKHHDRFMNIVPRTPKGLVYYNEWGPIRYATTAAFTALVAADLGFKQKEYREFGASQINYALGDCCDGKMSYVIGFGQSWPYSYHHRAASCKGGKCGCSPAPLPHTAWGGLVGGPDMEDNFPTEGCPDYIHSEVATDFNAGFTSGVAALKHLSMQGIHF